jgi:hypothetical protein
MEGKLPNPPPIFASFSFFPTDPTDSFIPFGRQNAIYLVEFGRVMRPPSLK